jgi:hypothetical protein
MLDILKKNKFPFKPQLLTIRWYPSNRTCFGGSSQRAKLQQMPPLMVRKAEWRR